MMVTMTVSVIFHVVLVRLLAILLVEFPLFLVIFLDGLLAVTVMRRRCGSVITVSSREEPVGIGIRVHRHGYALGANRE